MPLLFQCAISGEHRPISDGALREILQRALADADIRATTASRWSSLP
jgi:hypothetical protein